MPIHIGRGAGAPPIESVERIRIEHVRRQLETTFVAVEAIAAFCGFCSVDAMRRAGTFDVFSVASLVSRRELCIELNRAGDVSRCVQHRRIWTL